MTQMEEDDWSTVGRRVRRLRKILGERGQDFADSVGIHQSALSEIENGDRHLPYRAAMQIERRYNVPHDYFYFGDDRHVPYHLLKKLRDDASA